MANAGTNRSPAMVFVATLFTGGILMWYWIVLLMRDINWIEQRQLFAVRRMIIFVVALHGTFLFLFLWLMVNHGSDLELWAVIAAFLIAIAIMIVMFGSTVKIARRIARMRGDRFDLASALWIIFLTFYFVSPALLQKRLNGFNRRPPLPAAG
jgi:hypothetical protein